MSEERGDRFDEGGSLPARRAREVEIVEAEYVVVEAQPPRAGATAAPRSGDGWSWRVALAIGAIVACVSAALWSRVFALGLFGWDTFPLIAASRVESFADLGGVLGDELMRGRFPGGSYWRPLVHLSFAFDHARGGLDPDAYRFTDLAALVAGAVATAWLALALLGADRKVWALAAGLLFAMHPVHFELVALPPRRADSLSAAFTLLALWCVARSRTRTSWTAAMFALCACASKETGALCAVLAPALAASFCGAPFLRSRVKSGVIACWPVVAAVAAYVVARTLVLGGLGGGARTSAANVASELGRVASRYAQLVLAPMPPAEWASDGAALAFGAAALAVAAWTLVRAKPRLAPTAEIDPRRLCAWVGLWLASLAAITALSGTYRAWYAAPFVAPVALLAVSACASRAQLGRRRALSIAALVVLALLQGWTSSGARRWAELKASSRAAGEVLERFDVAATSTAPGSVVELDVAPPQESASRHGVETKRPMTFREYSLAAYAELAHPARKVRVEAKRNDSAAAAPDEVLVLLVGRE